AGVPGAGSLRTAAAGARRSAAGPADRLRPRPAPLLERAPRERAGGTGRPGARAGRIADAHVAGAYPVSARGNAPRRRRPGRAGHPAHRGPGRPAAALPVLRRPDRGGGAGVRTYGPGLDGPDPARRPTLLKRRSARLWPIHLAGRRPGPGATLLVTSVTGRRSGR